MVPHTNSLDGSPVYKLSPLSSVFGPLTYKKKNLSVPIVDWQDELKPPAQTVVKATGLLVLSWFCC